MNRATRSLLGIALTAGAMYFLDPASGRRRRARLRDQFTSATSRLDDGVRTAGRDLSNRLRGLGVRTGSLFKRDRSDDAVLVERVRAALGRVVSHPRAIEVATREGNVTLSGDVLADEYEELLRAARSVHGVSEVTDHLAVHESGDGVSSLQGGQLRPQRGFELVQENWTPAAQLFAGVTGGALVLNGLRHRSLLGTLGAGIGAALLLRSVTNVPLTRLAGAQGRRAIDIHKTITVQAPVEQVFSLLEAYENFPAFMRNVREVRRHDDGRSHWVVAGPAGASVEWDSETTARQPNEILAWRTVPNSTVAHAGIIRFEPTGDNGTRLDIQMSYNPPAGALGHVVAKLFGADPKTELDEDLMRMKAFLETGKPARDAAASRVPTGQRSS